MNPQAQTQQDHSPLELVHQEWVATFDAIRDPIFVTDTAGKIVRVNKACASLTNAAIKDVLGRHYNEVFTWLTAPLPVTKRPASAGSERSQHGHIFNSSGSIYKLRSFPLRSNNFYAVNILEDITDHFDLVEYEHKYREATNAAQIQTIQAMGAALHCKDPFTGAHEFRVAELGKLIAQTLGLTSDQIQGIYLGSLIHDIGKIAVPDAILHRPGQLTDTEMDLIKSHTRIGYDIVRQIQFPWPIHDIILHHHERLDGSGYPHRLKQNEISQEVRVIAVADTVEAMASHRPYRPAVGLDAALAEIKSGCGRIYDSEVVNACISVINDGGGDFLEFVDI